MNIWTVSNQKGGVGKTTTMAANAACIHCSRRVLTMPGHSPLIPGIVPYQGANARRAWLAGTVIEQMCALLDIDALTEELANGLA